MQRSELGGPSAGQRLGRHQSLYDNLAIWAVMTSLSYNTEYGQRYQESRDSSITCILLKHSLVM